MRASWLLRWGDSGVIYTVTGEPRSGGQAALDGLVDGASGHLKQVAQAVLFGKLEPGPPCQTIE
jgi:hypothetical protein